MSGFTITPTRDAEGVAALPSRLLAWWRAARACAEARAQLRAMSTRQLNDIGLGRSQIEFVTGRCCADQHLR